MHAPVGLDLGGDSPEAVGLAILAEIQSVLHEKNAISLTAHVEGSAARLSTLSLHPRDNALIEESSQPPDGVQTTHLFPADSGADSFSPPAPRRAWASPSSCCDCRHSRAKLSIHHAAGLASELRGRCQCLLCWVYPPRRFNSRRNYPAARCCGMRTGAEGLPSPARSGISAVMEQIPEASGAPPPVCDQPGLTADHLGQLLAAHQQLSNDDRGIALRCTYLACRR